MRSMGDTFLWFVGVVEDSTTDPLKLGRMKVRIIGVHTDNITILPTADLPWAMPMVPIYNASMQGIGTSPTGIVNGTFVVGFFRDGNAKQEPIIMGSIGGIPEKVGDTTKSFDGEYPKTIIIHSNHGINEADTNRLATNGTNEHKAFTDKKLPWAAANPTGQVLITPTANGGATWTEPAYSGVYGTIYPDNKVFETKSGHIFEFDDTPGSERINTQHKIGTYEELRPNGDKVTHVKKDHYELIMNDENVLIKGSCNVTIDANCRTYIKGNWDIQVDGNKTEVVTGTVSETYKSTKTETVTGQVTETYNNNQTTNITGTLDLDASTEIDADAGVINLN